MPTFLPMALALLAWPDPPADTAPAPVLAPEQVVAALETALGDAIARAEASVVAIARVRSENDETTAVRGRDPLPQHDLERRAMPPPFDPPGSEGLTFDYGSGVVVGDAGEILTAYHVVRGAARLR